MLLLGGAEDVSVDLGDEVVELEENLELKLETHELFLLPADGLWSFDDLAGLVGESVVSTFSEEDRRRRDERRGCC